MAKKKRKAETPASRTKQEFSGAIDAFADQAKKLDLDKLREEERQRRKIERLLSKPRVEFGI